MSCFQAFGLQTGIADNITQSVCEINFNRRYDLVLLSHYLYYHPCDMWLSFCKYLLSELPDNGILVIIINVDSGDWWRIIKHAKFVGLKPGFSYIVWSDFREKLRTLANFQYEPYAHTVTFNSIIDFEEFAWRTCLLIDRSLWTENVKLRFLDAVREDFEKVNGSIQLSFHSEICLLQKSSKLMKNTEVKPKAQTKTDKV